MTDTPRRITAMHPLSLDKQPANRECAKGMPQPNVWHLDLPVIPHAVSWAAVPPVEERSDET